MNFRKFKKSTEIKNSSGVETTLFKWESIKPLGDSDVRTPLKEVQPLVDQWNTRVKELTDTEPDVLVEFWKRLIRHWSIETGVLERVYQISEGVTKILVEQGLSSDLVERSESTMDPQLLITILRDHQEAVELCMDIVSKQRKLTIGSIKELHACIMKNQTTTTTFDEKGIARQIQLHPGDYKKWPNSVTLPDGSIHEYAPPEQVTSEMESLVTWAEGYIDLDPIVVAAWIHHRFTQIHPFQDGNGRLARVLANLILIRKKLLPVVIRRTDREKYLEALRLADTGDLTHLVYFFENREKDTLLTAISFEPFELKSLQSVSPEETAKQIALRFKRGQDSIRSQLLDILKTNCLLAKVGLHHALDELEVVHKLWHESGLETSPPQHSWGGPDDFGQEGDFYQPSTNHYFQRQIVELAQQHQIWINREGGRFWFRVRMHRFEERFQFICAIALVGKQPRGTAVALAFAETSQTPDEEETRMQSAIECMLRPFPISQNEEFEKTEQQFKEWVGECLALAIAEWGRTF